MDTTRHYLAGDIHSLEKVNKIVPRKMELPMLMQSRIQIRKNRFGIKSRFFEHMKSYDYKFKSLAAEPKQVIRALRPRTTCHPPKDAPQSQRRASIERSMVEKSSEWKLPPNVYRLKDNFQETSKTQMGKLGPYQCFTVERDVKTVKNHYAVKAAEDVGEIFYDLPSMMDEMLKASNRCKMKFLKGERFEKMNRLSGPPPTKYYPQNFVMKSKVTTSPDVIKQPLFYYPNTTVPVKEMLFNKESFVRPAPGRYDPHDFTCKCYLTKDNKRCPGSIPGDGHCHVIDSTTFRLVLPVKIGRRRTISEPTDDGIIRFPRLPREPISFRVRHSISSDDLMQNREPEIRYNTMVKKRNLFSVKTGRPVAFLTASPRFKEKSQIIIKSEKKKIILDLEEPEKPPRKQMTKERLEEIAAPKNPLPKLVAKKIEVFEKLPPMLTENLAKKPSTVKSPSQTSEVSLDN